MRKATYDMKFRLAVFDSMFTDTGFELLIKGAALIGHALKNVLESKLRITDELEIFEQGHTLFDYSHRLEMCRALDLIDHDLWHDLKIVGKMRNDAAHLRTGVPFSSSNGTFADRISLLNEIKALKRHPGLVQEDLPLEKRTGIIYEDSQSQLLWSLTEMLGKLNKIAPTPSGRLPSPKYQVGDRVKVKLTTDTKVYDLKGRLDAVGTIVDVPGKIVYNVRLDDPSDPDYNTLTYLTDDYIIEKL